MSNISGKAYAINVLTPMKPYRTWMQNLLFMLARVMPKSALRTSGAAAHPFRALGTHPAQPVAGTVGVKQTLDNDYMLFLSNFNGTWDQYIDAFADGIPRGLDLFWYTSTKYPHSIPISTFKSYITLNQIQTNYYYNATPGRRSATSRRRCACAAKSGLWPPSTRVAIPLPLPAPTTRR